MLAPLHTKYRRLNEAYIDVHNKQITETDVIKQIIFKSEHYDVYGDRF